MTDNKLIIVTSYDNPDLDGIACSIAYTELLNKIGMKAKAVYYGDLGIEVGFVKKYTKYFPVEKHEGKYDSNFKFVLVDTADPDAIEPTITPEKVIVIFDHRELVFVEKFINAKNTIELVGSCATLITEEFKKRKLKPSVNSAIYLYSAIISNTINFKNTVTTKRDRGAAKWLKGFIDLPKDYIKQMFSSKSSVNSKNLYQVLFQNFATKTVGDKSVGIAQIEIVDLEKTINNLQCELIKSLTKLKEENNLDYTLFSGVDIYKGFNIFYTIDSKSLQLFSKVLEISNLQPGYKTNNILMRKQIWPKLEKILSNSDN
jgi:inorganic pyrophosphatase/exopolyphosphatase